MLSRGILSPIVLIVFTKLNKSCWLKYQSNLFRLSCYMLPFGNVKFFSRPKFLRILFVLIFWWNVTSLANVCNPVATSSNISWKQQLLFFFVITVCFAALLQCFTGSDVLKWRSFYATQDDAWKAHYREVFDHGIREALCCMGRVKYL